MSKTEFELLALSCIRIKLTPDKYPYADPAEFDCTIDIDTGLFAGTIQTIFFDEDLTDFKDELEQLQVPGTVKLGGNRCAEITFEINKQIGGTAGSLAITVSATPNGDDPWPKLTFLEFEVPPGFPQTTINKIDQFLAQT